MKKEIKEKIIKILKNNYIEDSPDLILELFEAERQRLIKKIKSKRIKGVYFLDTQVEALLKLLKDNK